MTVAAKEMADQLSSARIVILQLLIALIGGTSLYGALDRLKETTAEDPFLLLKIFTVDRAPLPSFVGILGFLIPLVAIGLGFDAVNGEHNRRTLSRILAQPIYRDALLIGKFLAGLATLGSMLLCLWLLVIGFGLLYLGVPPGTEEIARSFVFLLVALAYCGVWLALAMLLSILFRSAATAALVALGVWLFLTLIWPMRRTGFGAGDRAAGFPLPDARAADAGDRRVADDPGAVLAEPAVRRMRAGDPVADDTLARPDLRGAASRRGGRLRPAAVPKPADRLAADGGARCRHDRAVRDRLHRVPASGSQSLT